MNDLRLGCVDDSTVAAFNALQKKASDLWYIHESTLVVGDVQGDPGVP
jgi:hypothetical protein